jgi:alpha-tubulin suppressor-like RCC1 family protein
VGLDNDWSFVDTGIYHSLALKSDSTLWAWGSNVAGQCGDGGNTINIIPKKIGTDHWAMLSAGYFHTLAIKNDRTLWVCGINNSGQIGNWTNTVNPSLIQLGVSNNWISIFAGKESSFVLKNDSTLWAMGRNNSYELGDGTNIGKNFLVQIGVGTDWGIIAPGFNHSVALKSDYTLWGWGNIVIGPPIGGFYYTKNIPTKMNDCGYITSLNNIVTSTYSIYPNPVNEILNIQNKINQTIEKISVMDVSGRKISEHKENDFELNIQGLKSGIYFIQILSEGKTYQYKFIKE